MNKIIIKKSIPGIILLFMLSLNLMANNNEDGKQGPECECENITEEVVSCSNCSLKRKIGSLLYCEYAEKGKCDGAATDTTSCMGVKFDYCSSNPALPAENCCDLTTVNQYAPFCDDVPKKDENGNYTQEKTGECGCYLDIMGTMEGTQCL